MKIAVLGPKGTFSDKAYLEYARYYKQQHPGKNLIPCYFSSIDEVFSAVDCTDESENKCEIGIVPIENTLDGYVMRTLDLLFEKSVYIIDYNLVEVQFSVVGNISSKQDINKLYVQFKANGQCRNFINSLKQVSICTTESNMESYYNIKSNIGEAAIVPKHVADLEERMFKIDNITDSESNYTRFVVFKRGEGKKDNFDLLKNKSKEIKIRASVFITPKVEKPGVLFGILKKFYAKNVNLISIMSRPTKKEIGKYNFYIEIECLYKDFNKVFKILDKLKAGNNVKMLGIYCV